MLWIVLPPAVGRQVRDPIAATNICIAIKVVIAINVDVVAAPPAVPAITPAPERSHRHTDTERDRHPCGVIPWRRIVDRWIRIYRRTVHRDGIVGRHVHDLWARRLDNDYTLLLSTVCVSTFCCSVDFKLPLSSAFLRMRCTAAITSPSCARKAFPKSVVH
jgi:hypothetical protein